MGDIESMPFIEAFRQFQFKVKRENFCNIHVSLVPQVSQSKLSFGEMERREKRMIFGFSSLFSFKYLSSGKQEIKKNFFTNFKVL